MKNYKKLAFRYLKMNRKRSIVTVMGVAVATIVLYLLLNLGWSGILNHRKMQREIQDYEIVFLTVTQEQIEQITKDAKVKNVRAGKYFAYDYYNPKTYDNALYVNTTNPYRMNAIRRELERKYQLESEINEEIAWTYLQGEDGSFFTVVILAVLLLCFFFAIFGVGIVRNSIQLSTLEQIKDYGNLRCIGSTRGQLKAIVYIEGAVLEGIGVFFGILLAMPISILIGHQIHWQAGFHFIPVLPIVIAFFGDLYFAMDENCKVIANMTPVSAIRGEYRIRKEKLKLRKRSIYGRLFGIEGDYAYKNIMRNPGRFRRTVWALGIGMALFIAVMGCYNAVLKFEKQLKDEYKYYQVYYENCFDPGETADGIQSALPPFETLEKIGNLKGVTGAKRIYSASVYIPDWQEKYSHYTEEYLTKTKGGNCEKENYDNTMECLEHGNQVGYYPTVVCRGYDEEDYARFQDVLIEGTLDVSDNGIVLVNNDKLELLDSESLYGEKTEIAYTDYKVGDTIELIDFKKLHTMVQEEMKSDLEEYEVEKEKLAKRIENNEVENPDEEWFSLYQKYEVDNGWSAAMHCVEKLKEQEEYKTYTIEGIVSENVNQEMEWYHDISFVLPLDKYFAFTGSDENVITGMMYHFDSFSYKEFEKVAGFGYQGDEGFYIEESSYPILMSILDTVKNVHYGIVAFVLFIVSMTAFNVINTTSSNIHLRRKEFAQLRVIGVSKNGLMKMIMLEGIIQTIVACLIGIIIGGGLTFVIFKVFVAMIYKTSYQFPIAATIIAFIVSILILCGSAYTSIRGMKQDVASDLTTAGE